MDHVNIAGYLLFAAITTITPGPNNYLLFAYGRKYSFKKSLVVMLGIFFGFMTILFISGYGIATIITQNKAIEMGLKIIGSIWMLYLAFVMSNIQTEDDHSKLLKIRFKEAYAMQFVNVKAWIMAMSAAGAFMPTFDNIHVNVLIYVAVFALVGVPSMFAWVILGDAISSWVKSPIFHRIIGYVLFALMLLTIVSIWI